MNCQSCGTLNTPGATFCGKCGTNMLGGGLPAAPLIAQTSGLAIAGFVCSFFCGLLGLILSIMAQSEIKQSNGRLAGEGLATAGIIISIIGMLVGLAVVASNQ